MDGFHRPWHVGMLWHQDQRLAAPVIRELRRDPDLVVWIGSSFILTFATLGLVGYGLFAELLVRFEPQLLRSQPLVALLTRSSR